MPGGDAIWAFPATTVTLLVAAILAAIAWDQIQLRRAPAPAGEDDAYRVFTTLYDRVLTPDDIPAMLRRISPDARHGLLAGRGQWEALLARPAPPQPAAVDLAARVAGALAGPAEDLAVTLLIDQSGSMKGEPMLATVAAVVRVVEALTLAGVRSEVLGFSTAGWRGGFARRHWLLRGRPPRPGRLCALLHLVYRPLGSGPLTDVARRAMLHPDLLRENVDGEALAWAAERLRQASAARRILLVLSDGAPVDDSTLTENGPDYLERHLLGEIAALEADPAITLGAIGIGFAVNRYYAHAREAAHAGIADATVDMLVALIDPESLGP